MKAYVIPSGRWRYEIDFTFIKSEQKLTLKAMSELAKKELSDLADAMDKKEDHSYADDARLLAEEFDGIKSTKRFDRVLDYVYDFGDSAKVWVKTL